MKEEFQKELLSSETSVRDHALGVWAATRGRQCHKLPGQQRSLVVAFPVRIKPNCHNRTVRSTGKLRNK